MKLVKLSEYFEIKYGVNLEFQNMKQDINGIPFVSRTEKNNGVAGIVQKIDNIAPNPSNTISVACGGSVMESFLQKNEYYSGRDLFYLKPKMDFTDSEMLFYCACLRANKYRYSYGRQANKTLSEIQIPHKNSIPDFVYKKDIKSISKEPLIKPKLELQTENWKVFKISKLFNVELGNPIHAEQLMNGSLPYITRTATNNGVECYGYGDKINDRNAITIGAEGIVAFYQRQDFITGNKINIIRHSKLNKYTAMFLCTILNFTNIGRFSYGRAIVKSRLKTLEIKLPATPQGEPDWEFMENYIKSLPYSSSL
jgi:hypothetical protein